MNCSPGDSDLFGLGNLSRSAPHLIQTETLMRYWLVLLTLIVTLSAAHAGKHDYFECTDSAGVVSFSTTKCLKGETQKIIRDDAPPAETVVTVPPSAFIGPASAGAAGTPGVILYATAWCGYCQKTRELFAEKHVRYLEHDIDKSAEGRAQHKKLGGKGVPVLDIGGTIIHGFKRNDILAALNMK